MSKINDEILGHADESDGIEEYDNPLPDWWVGMFILCVLWAGYYAADWHLLTPKTQAGLYEQEMAAAAETWPESEQEAVFDDSPAVLALGEEIFAKNCVACHGADLKGGIGPNLIDTEWIHGGQFADVVTTVTEGVPAKGMLAWGPILGGQKIAAVSSYVLAQNTGEAPTPAGGEAPAGGGVH